MPRWIPLVVAALIACAGSRPNVERAKSAQYQTEYDVVWAAVREAVTGRYDRIAIEQKESGQIVTDWFKVDKIVDSQHAQFGTMGGQNTPGARFFRAAVQIRGAGPEAQGPPWVVVVDGEAALYRPGLSSLIPYKHGDPDEPDWVSGRIDALYVAIFEKLRQYEVQAQVVPAAK